MPLALIPPGKRRNTTAYYARGTIDGQRFERSLKTRNRAIALARLRELEIELERSALEKPEPTFAEAALAYMKDRKAKLALKGVDYHNSREAAYMAHLLRHFRETRISEIDNRAIAAAAWALYPNAAAATRHRQAITPARAVLAHHERGGLRQGTPDNARVRWLTPEEAEQLIEAADAPTRRLILTLLGTGCRTGELVKLQVENINPPTAQAWIADPKNDNPRWAPIERARALPALMDGLPLTGAAFLTPKGQPYQIRANNSGGQFAVRFNKAREAAGLGTEVTPHVLRHTWATWFYAATGHNLVALMSAGGWKKTDMAMRYTKLAPADLAARLKKQGWNFASGAWLGERGAGPQLIQINQAVTGS